VTQAWRETPGGGSSERSAVAVTDTHSLLWHANQRVQKLGLRAREHFERTDRREAAIYVPTFVLAEVGELVHLGRVQLPSRFEE
jgi:PIN domain nuclease of toxin-antitoxin system